MARSGLVLTGLALVANGARVMRSDDISPFASKETTVNGCDCTNACGTSGGNYFKCDWCNVPSSCGGKRWTVFRGNYDFCAYKQVDAYEAQSHSKKMSTLWNQIMATKGRSTDTRGAFDTLKLIITESMRTPFDNNRDTMAPGRGKVIHQTGATCQFDLEISSSSPYTGLLAPGTSKGLVRMGSGLPPPSIFPGIAVKFLRSGVKSGNFVALRAIGDGDHGNFFDHDLSNHVAPPEMLSALQKFQQASDCPPMVGLSGLGEWDQNGKHTRSPKFPFELLFKTHSDMSPYSGKVEDPLTNLEKIPAGKGLYKVYAKAAPDAKAAYLGTMTTTTACHKSIFGDESLHFEHQRVEEDFARNPSWMSKISFEGCNPSDHDVSEWQCKYNQ